MLLGFPIVHRDKDSWRLIIESAQETLFDERLLKCKYVLILKARVGFPVRVGGTQVVHLKIIYRGELMKSLLVLEDCLRQQVLPVRRYGVVNEMGVVAND